MSVSITVISDTHLRHRELDLPEGDLLIHCGDMFNLDTRGSAEIAEIDNWFGLQKFDQILCVGGNHDHVLQAALKDQCQPFANAHVMQDARYDYAGLKIYGSPWVPNLPFHAFGRDEAGLARAWAQIPDDIDILITHTPPFGTLDRSRRGVSLGCPLLAEELQRIAPKVHCFGHVHASAGSVIRGEMRLINGSSIESGTGRILPPITFTITSDEAGWNDRRI